MTTGIYIISFCGRNRLYIGQSKNIERRWEEHISDLENERHSNPKMFWLWRKFQKTMRFHILEECSEEQLNKREQLYIDVGFEDHKASMINIQRTVQQLRRRFYKKPSEATQVIRKLKGEIE